MKNISKHVNKTIKLLKTLVNRIKHISTNILNTNKPIENISTRDHRADTPGLPTPKSADF